MKLKAKCKDRISGCESLLTIFLSLSDIPVQARAHFEIAIKATFIFLKTTRTQFFFSNK